LNVSIDIPPLRDHKEDIPGLDFSPKFGARIRLKPVQASRLKRCACWSIFTGRATRELQNILERAVTLPQGVLDVPTSISTAPTPLAPGFACASRRRHS
jgi:transcriptional regulator with GAF, ATPase, and Fis domain